MCRLLILVNGAQQLYTSCGHQVAVMPSVCPFCGEEVAECTAIRSNGEVIGPVKRASASDVPNCTTVVEKKA